MDSGGAGNAALVAIQRPRLEPPDPMID